MGYGIQRGRRRGGCWRLSMPRTTCSWRLEYDRGQRSFAGNFTIGSLEARWKWPSPSAENLSVKKPLVQEK
jgi:hypothetical protein